MRHRLFGAAALLAFSLPVAAFQLSAPATGALRVPSGPLARGPVAPAAPALAGRTSLTQTVVPGAASAEQPAAAERDRRALPTLLSLDGSLEPGDQQGGEGFETPDQGQTSAQAFDGAGNNFPPVMGGSLDEPDGVHQWWDAHTGQFETQQTKIRKAYELALSNPLAAAIKGGLSRNTLYRVQNDSRFVTQPVHTIGDDPEKNWETEPIVVFTHAGLRQLAPEYLAARLAAMWARHLYRETIPASAEKTYVEGSVMIRVFMALTNSTANWWNGAKDWFNHGNFETYRHFFHWIQGFDFPNVRQGPYFKDKIMGAQGDPAIETEARGRRTLFQRAQAGEISEDAATQAQQHFDGFVSNER